MFSLVLLVALGAVECVCIYFTRRPGGVVTSAAHLVLLAAMVAMLAAPADKVVVTAVGCAIGGIVAVAVVDRFRTVRSIPICGGQLIACSVATLTILLAMTLVPAATSGPPDTAMAGMPGMAPASSTVGSSLTTITATVVLALFAIRAVLETVRAWRIRRAGSGSPLRHSAAAAGSLSMVVMCAAMGAF